MDWRDYFDPISMAEPPYALADFDLIASLARERGAPEDENLDALLRQYPEFEAQFDRNKPNWGRYFDETYQTQGQQARSAAFQEYLANVYDLDPSTRLTLDDWRDQDLLSRIQNDYAAMAGRGPSAPGVGYLTESPQSAQRNALRYAWEDEWAKRLSTPDYDPRYAQRATSFAPNQFSPAANVYVDPFMQQGPRGGLREQVRTPGPPEEVNPLLGAPYTYRGTEQLAGRTIQPSPMPQMPMGMDQKAMTKFFGERDKEQETERKARQAQIEKSILAAHKKKQAELDKVEKDWHDLQWKLKQREEYNIPDTKGNITEASKGAYYQKLAEWAAHYKPADYRALVELSGGDEEVAKAKFASIWRAKVDPEYRARLEKMRQAKESLAEEEQKRINRKLLEAQAADLWPTMPSQTSVAPLLSRLRMRAGR